MDFPIHPLFYLQVSLTVYVPLAGVVIDQLGSEAQVVVELSFFTYLYWIAVLAGKLTVTVLFLERLSSVSECDLLLQVGYPAEDNNNAFVGSQLTNCDTLPVK